MFSIYPLLLLVTEAHIFCCRNVAALPYGILLGREYQVFDTVCLAVNKNNRQGIPI